MMKKPNNRRFLLAALLIFAVAVVFTQVRFRNSSSPDSAVKIGVVLPLSGSMAEYGKNGQAGLELAESQLKKMPGIKNFELIYQDTKDAPQDSVNAVRRLIDVNKVQFIIGGLTSSGVLAAAPYAQKKGVLFFSPAASAPGIPEIGNLVFRNWPPDDGLARQYGAAMHKRGIQRVAILSVANDYGKTNSAGFEAAFTAAGGKVIFKRTFPQGTTDFKTLVTQMSALGSVDRVLVIGYPDEFRAFFQELASANFPSERILVSDAFYSPQLIAELGPRAEGVTVAVAAKPDDTYKPRKDFIQAYRSRFQQSNGQPKNPGLVSDTSFDALHLLATGISKTDGTPQSVSNWLLNQVKQYPGAAGITDFTPEGDIKGKLALFQVKKGKFAPLKP